MRVLSLLVLLYPTVLQAEVPKVATDIAPVHALVSQVMQGVGTPDLVIPSGASPHSYAMRPSEARALSAADVVIWVGPALTPWLTEPLTALAVDAHKLALMEAEGMTLLPFREGEAFEAHDHANHHDAQDDHADHADEDENHAEEAQGHVDHDEAAHADTDHDHEEHDSDGHDGDAHDDKAHKDEGHHEAGYDPHLWLDPQNGAVALDAIAGILADIDPENAATYRANSGLGKERLAKVEKEITARIATARGRNFIVFHDAFHYFEARFDIEAAGAVSAGDAAAPGPARITALRAHVAEAAPVCAFAEPQMNTSVMQTVLEGQATQLATLDPMGSSLPLGADLYPDLLLGLADAMAECLAP